MQKDLFYLINILFVQIIFTCWVFPGIQIIVLFNCLFSCLSQANPQRTSSSEISECFRPTEVLGASLKSFPEGLIGCSRLLETALDYACFGFISGFIILGKLFLSFLHMQNKRTSTYLTTIFSILFLMWETKVIRFIKWLLSIKYLIHLNLFQLLSVPSVWILPLKWE